MMTMFSIGLRFVLTATIIATQKWYQQFQNNRMLDGFQFKPCDLTLIDGTVSYSATTAAQILYDVHVGNFFRFLRCLHGTQDDCFGYFSINNNPRTDGWYAVAFVAMYPSFERLPCVLWKTTMNYSTDPMPAWQQRWLWLICADLVLPFWMLMFLWTLEYDAWRQILYRKGYSTFLGFYMDPTFGGG